MTTEWILNQVFAFIGLIFVVLSFQQKESKRIILFYVLATLFVLIGLCIYGDASSIVLCSVGLIRNLTALFFAYKPNTKSSIKFTASVFLIFILILFNIIYWNNYLNILSIIIGTLATIMFMQKDAKIIRKLSLIFEILLIIYFALLLTPINVIMEIIGLTSVIIGIIRLDIKKKG